MVSERDEFQDDQVDDDQVMDSDEAVGAATDPMAADDATESLRDLVTYLVNNLVDEPDEVEIDVERRGTSVHIQLRLPEGDLGKVIGRGGRIAKAIRTVLLIAGSRHHLRVTLDIES